MVLVPAWKQSKARLKNSEKLYEEALTLLPGGVSSPVRAVKPFPFYVVRAKGSKIFDVDGNEYIDYCLGYGPLLLGHAHPAIKKAVETQLEKGWLFGTPHELELKLAKKIVRYYKSVEMVRFVNSGTEATMSAIRLARGFTSREKILKIEGGFHGAHDAVLVKAGSAATAIPASKGIPMNLIENTLQVPFNDVEALSEVVEKKKEELAAFILEPVLGNVGLILPEKGYLEEVRKVTAENDVLLIFDEIITGFRLGMGGAQERFGIYPDITTLGKVVGGGFPLGVVGARREIMEFIAPAGEVYQAGTFNGNPVSLCGGLATVEVLERARIHEKLEKMGRELVRALKDIISDKKLEYGVSGISSMFQIFFGQFDGHPPRNYEEALRCDREKYLGLFWRMLQRGVFLPPSQFETCFLSAAHSDDDIKTTVEAYEEILKRLC